jgi:hypothetical protein
MATDEKRSGPQRDPEELARRLVALTARSQRLGQQLLIRQARQATGAEFSLIDVAGVSRAFLEAPAKLAADPAKLARAPAAPWQDSLALWRRALGGAADERADDVGEPDPADRRFKGAAWREHPLFGQLKRSYLLTSR